MHRAANLALTAIVAITLLLAGFVEADCPGVDHVTFTQDGWQYDEFFEEGTSNPLTVELTVIAVDSGTEVYYYDGTWHALAENTTVQGSRTRFTDGGRISITFSYGSCGGEIQPYDD